ncbi:HNH endonuclease, partial [Acinetobacter baumannii]|nr:HNH endonuclease [Acinetobacter baumannii]
LFGKSVWYFDLARNFGFLGWHVRRYGSNKSSKLLIKPSRKNFQNIYAKIRGIIKSHAAVPQYVLIGKLNPVIRGWVNYHKHQVASDAFSKLDALIFRSLWNWSTRRHSMKGARWVKAKYFHHIDTRHWTFAAEIPETKDRMLKLVYCVDTHIKRHVKIKSDYNPFDQSFELYGERLRCERWSDKHQHRKQQVSLFEQQKGICMLCQQALTEETGWDDHHIIYRMNGGDDTLSNRVLLHPNCHRELHARHLSVFKPASQKV